MQNRDSSRDRPGPAGPPGRVEPVPPGAAPPGGRPPSAQELDAWKRALDQQERALALREEELRRRRQALVEEERELEAEEQRLLREFAYRFPAEARRMRQAAPATGAGPLGLGRLAAGPRPRAFQVFLALNIAAFLVDLVLPGSPLTLWGIKFGPYIWLRGESYRLISSVFLHAGLLHLLFNSYALYLLGPMVEPLIGSPRFVLLYLVSGVTGSAASLLLRPLTPSLGASGAIFGLMGFLLYLRWRRPHQIPRSWGQWLYQVLGINLLISFLPGSRIDVWGHVGGLVGGFVSGFLLDPTPEAAAGKAGFGLPSRLAERLAALAALLALVWWSLRFPG